MVRIGNRFQGRNLRNVTHTHYTDKIETFQNALIAQTSKQKSDTVNISGPIAIQRLSETEHTAHMTDPDTILSMNSVQAKLERLQKISETADYTDMSYEKIYCTIWERYQQAFNGKMSAITSCLIGGKGWAEINNQFVNEVNKAVFFPLYQKIKNETGLRKGTQEFSEYWKEHYDHKFSSAALGYGEMSVTEKEQAIRDKYAGCHSIYDFASMMGELSDAGILSQQMGDRASFSCMNLIRRELVNKCFPDSYSGCPTDEEWARIIYQSFDAWGFLMGMKESLKCIKFENWNFDIQSILDKVVDNLLYAVSY